MVGSFIYLVKEGCFKKTPSVEDQEELMREEMTDYEEKQGDAITNNMNTLNTLEANKPLVLENMLRKSMGYNEIFSDKSKSLRNFHTSESQAGATFNEKDLTNAILLENAALRGVLP